MAPPDFAKSDLAGEEALRHSRSCGAPPRPRLTIRVGITGHRWDKLDVARKGALIAQLRAILQQIEGIAHAIVDDPAAGYRSPHRLAGEPVALRPEFRMLSALAEGADRLIVEAAPKGWRLQALLPFPEAVYRRDFAPVPEGESDPFSELLDRAGAEAGIVVLDGDRQAANAFEPVGTLLCLNSDVLIAVWNGQPSQGRGRGGTATVVDLASELGIPVIRVAPDAGAPPWLHPAAGLPSREADGLASLEERLRRAFVAPASPYPVGLDEGEVGVGEDLRESYFHEDRHAAGTGRLYTLVVRLCNLHFVPERERAESWSDFGRAISAFLLGWSRKRRAERRRNYGEAIRDRWRRQWQNQAGLPDEFITPLLTTPLADHYGWASTLAGHYAGRYRDAFLVGYALSWVAVFAGATGLAVSALGIYEHWAPLATGLTELVLLLIILAVVVQARQNKYHERWLDYRQITESLRPLTYTLPVVRAAIRRIAPGAGRDTWVDWFHRAVVREVGLYPARMTPAHLGLARRQLVEGELADQIRYHRRNAKALSLAGRRLHFGATLVFYVALLLALLHVKESLLHGHPELVSQASWYFLGVIGLTIPAVASAIHGFVSQAEFEETAQRSRATAARLEELGEAGRDPAFPLTAAALGDLSAACAQAMGEEVGAWFAAYQAKGVSLP